MNQDTISNAAFLDAIFNDTRPDEYLWVTAFSCSPENANGKEWGGKRTTANSCSDYKHGNGYFSVAALKPIGNSVARQKANFSRLYCLVLDDADDCELMPTWRLRTSPNKVQIGFRLSVPLDDVGVATRLHEALGKGGRIPADKNGNNPVRYVRLPVALNTKHSPPFHCQLEHFAPRITHDLVDLLESLGLDANFILKGAKPPMGSTDFATPSDRQTDAELIRLIVSGESFHDPLLKLTARYAQRGMDQHAIIEVIRGAMQTSSDVGSDRWKNRYEDIERTVRGADKFRPEAMPKREAFTLVTAEEIAALPPLSWRVKHVLPAQGLTAIYGPSGSGKSFLALDMLAAVADGREWYGHRCYPAPVVYVCLEGEAGLSQRLQAYRKHHGNEAASAMRFVTAPFRLLESADVGELAKIILDANGAGAVVCLDTLNQATPGADENSSEDMGKAIAAAKRLQSTLGGLVVLVHHAGKDLTRGMRGHSSLYAALDAVVEVTRNGDARSWKTTKSKDGADGAEHFFKLEVVELGVDEDLECVTSCIVRPGENERNRTKRLTPAQQTALQALVEACRGKGQSFPDSAIGGVAAHLDDWRDAFYRVSTADNADAKRKAFQRARKDLVEASEISVINDIYRPNDFGVQASIAFSSTSGTRDIGGTFAGHVTPLMVLDRDIAGQHPMGCPVVPLSGGGSGGIQCAA